MMRASELRVLNCLFEPRIAGPSVRVIGVSRVLSERGIETVLCIPDIDGPVDEAVRKEGMRVERLHFRRPPRPTSPIDMFKFLCALPGDIWRFRKLIKKVQPDIIHVNGVMFPQPAFAGRLAGKRVVWHLNDTILPPPLAKIAGWVIRLVSTDPVAAAGAVGDHYGVKNLTILYAPVDAERFPARTARVSSDEIRIGMVGNWNYVKGQERFIRVIAKLKERLDRPVRGIIVGRVLDNQRSYHQKIMSEVDELGLSGNIEVMGFQENPAQTISTFDLQLLPSHSEACPISVLEAMSVGIPVVAFAVGGVREELEREGCIAGLVVENGNCDEMAAASINLLSDDRLYDMCAKNGPEVVKNVFVLDRIADAHEKLYRRKAG